MIKELFEKSEKKVEYIELIYDLIFVYIIGRNNSLLHHFSGGFVEGGMFLTYVICTLTVIQIWNYSTYYINLYGKNCPREYVFLFVNMFLMYFLAEGTREDWQKYHTSYNTAWALILVNIAVQYALELKKQSAPAARKQIKKMLVILLVQAAIVLASIPTYDLTGSALLAPAAILFGMVATMISGRKSDGRAVDFSHLSERAMLYVVFTFGEMIIAISVYFDGNLSVSRVYFSAVAFLIVTALFLSYGVLYDRIVDREMQTTGLGYMLIHIVIVFALNNITNSLEFMHEESVALLPKILFLIFSLMLYYAALFSTGAYAKIKCRPKFSFFLIMLAFAVSFAVVMLLLKSIMEINIAVTAVYTFAVYYILHRFGKKSLQ